MANGRTLAMAAPLVLRTDFTADDVRRHARRTRDADQVRRLLALATIYEGGSRGDAATRRGRRAHGATGVGLQIVRDWVERFNAEGPDGLADRKAPGPVPRLNEVQRQALAAAVESGPAAPCALRRPCTASGRRVARRTSCAGGWLIWRSGSGKSSASWSAHRRL